MNRVPSSIPIRRVRRWLDAASWLVLAVVVLIRNVSLEEGYEQLEGAPPVPDGVTSGELTVLTYNVAGLPQIISPVRPRDHAAEVGGRLNAFDLVLLQEDFCYHQAIMAATTLPCRSFGGRGELLFGDGLTQLARLPMTPAVRRPWTVANGVLTGYNDELAEKGFSCTAVTVAAGIDLDVYNLHADAGEGRDDERARAAQLDQLARHISAHSANRPILVGGDFNILFSRSGDRAALAPFLATTGLESVYDRLGGTPGVLDGFLVRSGAGVRLEPRSWWIPEGWTDSAGRPVSDHEPIALRLAWTRAETDRGT